VPGIDHVEDADSHAVHRPLRRPAIGIARFDLDLNEWANQPPHGRSIELTGNETAASVAGSNETASASWSGTVNLRSFRVGGGSVPGVSQDEKDFAAFEFLGELLQFVSECYVADGNAVFSAPPPPRHPSSARPCRRRRRSTAR
jgi:hypothetical protein